MRTGSGTREDRSRPVQHEAVQGSLSGRPVRRRNSRTGHSEGQGAPRRKWSPGHRRNHLHHGLPPDEGWQQGYRIPQGQPPHWRSQEGPERCSGSRHQEHEGWRCKHLPHCPWQPELGRPGSDPQQVRDFREVHKTSFKTLQKRLRASARSLFCSGKNQTRKDLKKILKSLFFKEVYE